MVEYMEAIKKPFSDLKTLGIGAVLGAIPIVNLLVSGYAAKTAEDTMAKKNKLRAWKFDDAVEYLIKAIMMIVISIVYSIVPLIIIGAGVGGAVIAAISSGISNPETMLTALLGSLAVGAPIILIGVILLIIAAFLTPMAIMKWLQKGNLGAAFNIMDVIKNALTANYIISFILIIVIAIVYSAVAAIISGILALIPVIGFIIALLISGAISFAISVTSYTIFAQTVKK